MPKTLVDTINLGKLIKAVEHGLNNNPYIHPEDITFEVDPTVSPHSFNRIYVVLHGERYHISIFKPSPPPEYKEVD